MPDSDGFTLRFGETANCANVASEIPRLLDGEADSILTQRVEGHLRTCPSCAREMEQQRRLLEKLRAVATVDPPAYLWERIHAGAGPAGRAPGTALAVGSPGRRGLRGHVARLLLLVYDGDLARQTAATGSCRETGQEPHGWITLALGLAAGALPLNPGWWLLALPLLWLASTRLETRWSGLQVGLLAGLGAAGGTAWEIVQAGAHLTSAPLGLSGCIATLAVAQIAAAPRLRPEILGLFRVPSLTRGAVVLAAACGLARPDLLGPLALLPAAAGAGMALVAAGIGARKTDV